MVSRERLVREYATATATATATTYLLLAATPVSVPPDVSLKSSL